MQIVQHLSDPVWWVELYVHFLAICSAAYRFLSPSQTWAEDNLSAEHSKKYKSFLELLGIYGALSPPPVPRHIWNDEERQKQLGEKAQAAGGNG